MDRSQSSGQFFSEGSCDVATSCLPPLDSTISIGRSISGAKDMVFARDSPRSVKVYNLTYRCLRKLMMTFGATKLSALSKFRSLPPSLIGFDDFDFLERFLFRIEDSELLDDDDDIESSDVAESV